MKIQGIAFPGNLVKSQLKARGLWPEEHSGKQELSYYTPFPPTPSSSLGLP